jgi:hypothetical protein
VSVLWDVHTLPAAGPVRHYQQYPDEPAAERMRVHLAGVLHVVLVVDPVEAPEPLPAVSR